MDKISATLRARVVSQYTKSYQKRDGSTGSEIKVSVLPEGRNMPITVSAAPECALDQDTWYDFDVLIRAHAYADRDTQAPTGSLSVWCRAAVPVEVLAASRKAS